MAIPAFKQTETIVEARPNDPQPVDRANAFLAALTELSIQHGVAIGGTPVLFMMEREDYDSAYSIDAESDLSFG